MTPTERPSTVVSPGCSTGPRVSGMDDMRVIARKSARVDAHPRVTADELSAVGGSTLGATPLAVPNLTPPRAQSRTRQAVGGFLLGAAAMVLSTSALARVGVGVTDLLPRSTPVAVVTEEPTEATAEETESVVATVAPEPPEASGPLPVVHEEAPVQEVDVVRTSKTRAGTRTPRVPRPTRTSQVDRGEPVVEGSASAQSESGGESRTELQALIDRALAGGGSSSDDVEEGPTLPLLPTRAEVSSALRSVEDEVLACGDGAHGVATVRVVVDGATGRVMSSRIEGDFAGTSVGSCVARTTRQATFPRFEKERFEVVFPYRL